jgi:hypothetical protein
MSLNFLSLAYLEINFLDLFFDCKILQNFIHYLINFLTILVRVMPFVVHLKVLFDAKLFVAQLALIIKDVRMDCLELN